MKKVSKNTTFPLMLTPISAGFPSPGEETIETDLDLNQLMIKHPSATFLMRVAGDSMKNIGIFDGDIVVVDKSLNPKSKDIIVAYIEGDFTLKRFLRNGDKGQLQPENDDYSPLLLDGDSDFQVWGVVTYTIHQHNR